jgi:hypothetical protein
VGKGKDLAAIKMVLDDWVAAANAGDAAAMAVLFTDDGILMLPNEPSVIGKEAIRSHLQAHFDECGGAGAPRKTDALYQPSADAPPSDEELRFDYRPERGTLPLSETINDRSDDSLAGLAINRGQGQVGADREAPVGRYLEGIPRYLEQTTPFAVGGFSDKDGVFRWRLQE